MLFVQNPSMVLAALACVYSGLAQIPLIVDRHTTFRLNQPKTRSVSVAVFEALSSFTIRHASLTLVTNRFLAEIVEEKGGTAFILPDPIPALVRSATPELRGDYPILFISSFAEDEPLSEVLQAARLLTCSGVHIYVTGNPAKADRDLLSGAPSNVHFTGFLSEQAFADILHAVLGVLVLTRWDHIMLCGAYEAVAAGKPLITSRKAVLVEYFQGAEFVGDSAEDIARGIKNVIEDVPGASSRINRLQGNLRTRDEANIQELWKAIATLLPPSRTRSQANQRS